MKKPGNRLSGGEKKNSPEGAERGSKSLHRPAERWEVKIKADSDRRFSLCYRHYSEKIFKKEDNNEYKNKLII